MVESGNVNAGIVYKTDALISKKVRVAFEMVPPLTVAPKISYLLAVKRRSRPAHAGPPLKFAAYLASPVLEARAVFAKYGFIALLPWTPTADVR